MEVPVEDEPPALPSKAVAVDKISIGVNDVVDRCATDDAVPVPPAISSGLTAIWDSARNALQSTKSGIESLLPAPLDMNAARLSLTQSYSERSLPATPQSTISSRARRLRKHSFDEEDVLAKKQTQQMMLQFGIDDIHINRLGREEDAMMVSMPGNETDEELEEFDEVDVDAGFEIGLEKVAETESSLEAPMLALDLSQNDSLAIDESETVTLRDEEVLEKEARAGVEVKGSAVAAIAAVEAEVEAEEMVDHPVDIEVEPSGAKMSEDAECEARIPVVDSIDTSTVDAAIALEAERPATPDLDMDCESSSVSSSIASAISLVNSQGSPPTTNAAAPIEAEVGITDSPSSPYASIFAPLSILDSPRVDSPLIDSPLTDSSTIDSPKEHFVAVSPEMASAPRQKRKRRAAPTIVPTNVVTVGAVEKMTSPQLSGVMPEVEWTYLDRSQGWKR